MARRGTMRAIGRLILTAARHAAAARLILGVLLLLSIAAIVSGRFSTDISRMLPDGSASAETYRAVSRSGMFNKVVLVFYLPPGRSFEESGLAAYMEELAPRLEALPLVESVDFRFPGGLAESVQGLARYVPQLSPVPRTAPAAAARNVYRQLLTPGGIGRTGMLRSDPFNETGTLFGKLEQFRVLSGMNISPEFPYLVSVDKTAAMMLIESPVSVSDAAGSAGLLDSIRSVLGTLPAGTEYDLISAHRRAVCNEAVLRNDVKVVCWTSAILFALLFILFYRCDLRSFLIPLIPVLASSVVLGVMCLLFRETLFFVIGMGGIVVSLAVDYGIHTYAAMTGKGRFLRLLRLVPALCLGALTSVIAFALFLFSRTEGCRQLGFFAGGSLLLSLLMMLLFLPAFLAKGRRIGYRFHAPGLPERFPRAVIFLWCAAMTAAVVLLPRLRIHADVRQFDVSPPEFGCQEAKQNAKFMSGRRPAIALVQGGSRAEVFRNLENGIGILRGKAEMPLFAVSDLWPSAERREKNLTEWKRFRAEGGMERMRREFAASELGEDFFQPFFEAVNRGIDDPPSDPPAFLEPVLKRLVSEKNGVVTAAFFFPDTPENIENVRAFASPLIVSPEGLAQQMSSDVMRGILPLGVLALFGVVFLTSLYFRSFADTLLALLPVASGLLLTAAVFAILGYVVNLSVLIAAVILCGLAVDYGIFVLHSLKQSGRIEPGVFNAVTLSAVTSAAGGATVIFTRHPMLRDAGVTLIVGIAAAWLTSVFVIPAMRRKFPSRRALALPVCAAALLFCSCASDPFEYEMPDRIPVVAPAEFTQESSIVMEYPFFRIPALGMVRIDRTRGTIAVAGFSPAGMKLFDISGTEETLSAYWLIPAEQWKGRERETARAILDDIAAVYLHNEPDAGAAAREAGHRTVYESGLGVWVFRESVLREKTVLRNGGTAARIRFYAYRNGIPSKVVLENRKYGYRLIIRAFEEEKQP